MKKIIFFVCLFLTFPLMARDIEADKVSLQAMDKITGRVKTLTFPIGSQVQFEELTIKANRCVTKSPEETPENSAFLVVSTKDKNLFKGWMFSSNPALSAMENDVYDLWVVSCSKQEELPQLPSEDIPSEIENIEEEEEVIPEPNEPIED